MAAYDYPPHRPRQLSPEKKAELERDVTALSAELAQRSPHSTRGEPPAMPPPQQQQQQHHHRRLLFPLLGGLLALSLLGVWLHWGQTILLRLSDHPAPEQQQEISQQDLHLTLDDLPLRDPSEDEIRELAAGKLTKESLTQRLVDAEEADPYQKSLAYLVARIYALRATFTGTLDSMMAQAEAEYADFSPQQKEHSALMSWVSGYVSRATGLEQQCDDELDAVLAEMTDLIRDKGGDLALIDEVAEKYATEKSLKKSQYIEKLEERGLL